MAELNKIKAEKARDEAEKEAGRREEDEQIRMENILSGKMLFDNFNTVITCILQGTLF